MSVEGMNSELLRFIRREIRQQMNIILNSYVGTSTTEDQEIDQPVPEADKTEPRPVVHPWGYCSRAPEGMLAVTARVGDHPGAKILIGFRDQARALMSWLEEGEATLYSATGEKVLVRANKVQLGSENAANPVVLGTELKELLTNILDLLIAGNHVLVTSPGNPTAPNPTAVAQLNAWKSQYLTTAATNIVSQHVFAERSKP